MKPRLASLLVAAALAGCASLEPPVPVGYNGPTAVISDTVVQEDKSKGQLFYVEAVDGKPIDSALIATRQASSGHGFQLSLWSKMRQVPVKPLRLRLVASHVTAAPIHEIASRAAGTFLSVQGEVSFTPVDGGDYVVKGELTKEGSSVWLADAKTLQPVTSIVTEKK
jgi:hypothetical protein